MWRPQSPANDNILFDLPGGRCHGTSADQGLGHCRNMMIRLGDCSRRSATVFALRGTCSHVVVIWRRPRRSGTRLPSTGHRLGISDHIRSVCDSDSTSSEREPPKMRDPQLGPQDPYEKDAQVKKLLINENSHVHSASPHFGGLLRPSMDCGATPGLPQTSLCIYLENAPLVFVVNRCQSNSFCLALVV